MRLRCLGLTWKCYICWSPQLHDTQAEGECTLMKILINRNCTHTDVKCITL